MMKEDVLFRPTIADPAKLLDLITALLGSYGINRRYFRSEGADAVALAVKKYLKKDLHPTVLDKLRAYHAALTKEAVYQNWHVIYITFSTLYDGVANVEHFEPPSLMETLIGAYITTRDAPTLVDKANDEVKEAITVLWQKHFGLLYPHPVIYPYWKGPELPDRIREMMVEFLRNEAARPNERSVDEMQAFLLAALQRELERYQTLNELGEV